MVGYASSLPSARYIEPNHFESWSAGEPCEKACFDRGGGVLEARTTEFGCGYEVDRKDRFWLTGPAGPPITFEFVLIATAEIEGEGRVDGLVLKGAPLVYETFILSASGSGQAVVPLTYAPGETFEVFSTLSATRPEGRIGSAHALGRVAFRGLPPGHHVVGCDYELPVPAARVSWGRVKGSYR
jgi:hypothetical protein